MAVTPLWVAFFDKIATSPDGITWTQKLDITAGAEFIANLSWDGQQTFVGSGSVIVTSTDGGVTWSTTLADTFPVLEYDLGRSEYAAAAWNGTVWCVVGNSGGTSTSNVHSTTTFTSTTGSSWTPHVLGFGNNSTFNGIAWSDVNSLFVASGFNSSGVGVIYSSPDGVTWTLRHTATGNPTQDLSNVIWNGSQYLVIGHDTGGTSYVITSFDGITWIETAAVGVGNFSGAYSVILWDILTTAYYVVDGSGNLQRSHNGKTWTQVITASGTVFCDTIARAGSVLITDGGKFQTSTDGITWTITDPSNNSNNMQPLASDGITIAGVTNNSNGVSTTPDYGNTWVSRLSDPGNYSTMYFFGSQPTTPSTTTTLFAYGNEQTIITSHDLGLTWKQTHFNSSSDAIQNIIGNGSGTFVAVGQTSLFYSLDGDTWTQVTLSPKTYLFNDFGRAGSPCIIWDGARFVLVGSDTTSSFTGCIGTSSDGITWSFTTFPGTQCFSVVGLHAGQYVLVNNNIPAFATNCKFYTTPDLVTLTLRYNANFATYGSDLRFLGGQWVLFANSGVDSFSAASPDGITWSESPPLSGHPGQYSGMFVNQPIQVIFDSINNLYVGTGNPFTNPGVAWSTDNLTWNYVESDGTVAVNVDRTYQVGSVDYSYFGDGGSPAFAPRLHSSTDGKTWTPIGSFNTQGWGPYYFTPISTYYVAPMTGQVFNAIGISQDSENWASVYTDPTFDINGIAVVTNTTPPPPSGTNQTILMINT